MKEFLSKECLLFLLLYTHPDVMSVRQDVERFFIHNKDGKLNPSKSFQIINDSIITFNFQYKVDDPLFITGLPIIPEHIFSKIPIKQIFNSELNFKPIGIGPYVLENYQRQQQIVLRRNDPSFYDKIPFIEKLIYKVIPDYNSRINQLKKWRN